MDKKDVIKITLELIKENKLEKTSVGKLVKKLDASPGNLYYYFKNKDEIYEKTMEYSFAKITKELASVKIEKDMWQNIYKLTERLIRFLEEREEILFFLISVKGSSYLSKSVNSLNFLNVFKKYLLEKEENNLDLKLRLYVGGIYEILYQSRIIENRKLRKNEINEIYESFRRIL